jgi:hypothetical protein
VFSVLKNTTFMEGMKNACVILDRELKMEDIISNF